MDIDKIKEIVKSIVDDTLSNQEKAKALSDMEGAVIEAKATIEELTSALALKNADYASVTSELENANVKLASVESRAIAAEATVESRDKEIMVLAVEKEELEKKVLEVGERASSLQTQLDEIHRSAVQASRIAELEASKVLRPGKSGEDQKLKVRDLSDEEFASYKSDLVALREEILSSLPTDSENTEVASDEEAKEVAGLINLEQPMPEDLGERYRKLGEALAGQVKKRIS